MLTDSVWLSQHLNQPDLRIVDCRYALGKPEAGKELYLEGHIPGAIHLDIDSDLSGKAGPGRHPLPKAVDFSAAMSNAGIDQDITVIAYDDMGGAWAARLWWLLRYFGHEKVFILNGGWTKWTAEKNELAKVVPHFKARSFKASPHPEWVVSREVIQKNLGREDFLLLDARTPERYRGESEPVDKQAGHVPGAKNAPFMENTEGLNREFRTPDALKEKFKSLGVFQAKEVVCYCGSGVTACNNIFALKMVGKDAKLYEGSWSDWSADTTLPIKKTD